MLNKILHYLPFQNEKLAFYYSALLFAFTLSLSRAAISFFLIWFVILFLTQKDLKNSWKAIKENQIIRVIGLFFTFLCLSLIWSENTHEAINQIRLYSYWVLIPILAVSLKKEWLPHIISAFLLGMFISEILTYGIFFELWQINGKTPSDPNPFMIHIHYSILLATTAIILLNRLLSNRYTLLAKIPMSIFFLTTTINLFISGGRTGQVALLITIGLAIIIHFKMTLKAAIIFISLNTFLFIGTYFIIPNYKDRIQQAVSDLEMQQKGVFYSSVGLRNGFWIVAADAFKINPLLGAGAGDYKHATIEALSQDNHDFDIAAINFFTVSDYHNQYLMILIQFGLIGFSLIVWLILLLYRLPIKDKEFKELSLLSLTIFFISALSESLWICQFPIILFIFIVSVSLVSAKEDDTIQKQ